MSRISSRERVQAALSHQVRDRVPIEYHTFGTPEMLAKLRGHLKCGDDEQLRRRLGIDVRRVVPTYMGPPRPAAPGQREDFWGVIREPVSHGSGAYEEIVYYPLAEASSVEDLERHRWPKVEWFDYRSLVRQIEQINGSSEEYAIELGNGRIFEASWFMCGWEKILLDIVANPDFVAALLHRVTDFFIDYFTAALTEARGLIDIAFTSDDVAMQHGPVMSLDVWRRLLKPEHARLNQVLHQYGVKIIYHSCGAVMDFLEDFVDMGIDALEPLQFSAVNMDPAQMKARVGDRLCFHGGVDVQTVLPFGTPDSVRRRSRELIEVLGRGGGYIFGPSHSIQEDTPVENVVAMFDTALGR